VKNGRNTVGRVAPRTPLNGAHGVTRPTTAKRSSSPSTPHQDETDCALPLAERGGDGSRGLQPTDWTETVLVAERRLKVRFHPSMAFKRRSATHSFASLPWAKAHGYRQVVAPRPGSGQAGRNQRKVVGAGSRAGQDGASAESKFSVEGLLSPPAAAFGSTAPPRRWQRRTGPALGSFVLNP